MIQFCRDHEKAITIREKELELKQRQFEYKISSRRRTRREWERLFSSTVSVLVLMVIAFCLGLFVGDFV